MRHSREIVDASCLEFVCHVTKLDDKVHVLGLADHVDESTSDPPEKVCVSHKSSSFISLAYASFIV